MGWGEYARSKMPLKLVFILIAAVAVNMLIIGAFELLLHYRYTGPVDTAVLARMSSEYENCTILDSYTDDTQVPLWEGTHTAYLLETENGETKLAAVEKHFLFNRYRYWEEFSTDVPKQEGRQSLIPGDLYHQALYWINDNSVIESFSMGQNYGPGISLVLIPMIIIEYLAFIFVFRRDELL